MDIELINSLISSSVELAVLAGVLYGLYRLTFRVIDIMMVKIDRCCESLEQIADALREIKKE